MTRDDLLKEFFETPKCLKVADRLAFMQVARLERIAEALEHIQQDAACLSGCISPTGSFCIAGDYYII